MKNSNYLFLFHSTFALNQKPAETSSNKNSDALLKDAIFHEKVATANGKQELYSKLDGWGFLEEDFSIDWERELHGSSLSFSFSFAHKANKSKKNKVKKMVIKESKYSASETETNIIEETKLDVSVASEKIEVSQEETTKDNVVDYSVESAASSAAGKATSLAIASITALALGLVLIVHLIEILVTIFPDVCPINFFFDRILFQYIN